MTLRIRLLLPLFRPRGGRIFVALMVVGGIVGFHVAVAEAQVASNFFIYPFNPAVSKISLAPSVRWGLFRPSDYITISTMDNSAIRVLTMDGTVVHFGPPITLQLGPGHYFVECNGDRTQFCVLPNDYDGGNFLGMEALPLDNDTNVISAVSPSWLRMMGGSGAFWSDVQPQAGTFSWTTADQVIGNNAGPGRKLIWSAFNRPTWLTDDNQFISLYSNYVSQVAARYGSQLHAIEIWNEPWTTCSLWGRLPNLGSPNECMTNWQQMAQSYSAVLQAARAAIKSVAPNVRVIGPAWTSPQYADVTAYLNELGGTALLDALTFHDYDDGCAPPDQAIISSGTGILYPRVDQNLGAFQSALGNSSTPMLADEVGLYGQSALGIPNTGDPTYLSGISWQRGMYRAIKIGVMYAAGGVEAIIPHVLYMSTSNVNSNEEIYGYEAGDRGPHPKTSAFLMTSYWLNGATFVNHFTPGTNVFLYAWQLANNTSLVFAWAVEGQTVPLLNTTLAATDIYGNSLPVSSLTEMPVLFRSSTLSAAALLTNVLAAIPPSVNLPPIVSPLGSQSVQEGQPLQFAVSATDLNLYSLTYAALPLPAGALFNSNTGVFSWTPTTSQVGNYSLALTANDGPVTSTPLPLTVSVVKSLFDGLTNYWKFDENAGMTATDSVGQANGTLSHFSSTPPAGWVPGKSGSALSFDGIESSVVLPSSALSFPNNFTMATWLNPRNASGDSAFISIRCCYPTSGFRFFIANNALNVQGATSAGWQAMTVGNGFFQNGNWYQVAAVYDKSTIVAYANGVYLGSAYWGGDLVMTTNTLSHIGTEGSYYFNGTIDEMMFFNRALGSNEVSLLYNLDNQVPAITSLQFTNSSAVISFMTVTNTVTNELYEVDYRNDLHTGTWLILTNGVPGTGGMVSITDSGAAGQGKRFYRVGVHF